MLFGHCKTDVRPKETQEAEEHRPLGFSRLVYPIREDRIPCILSDRKDVETQSQTQGGVVVQNGGLLAEVAGGQAISVYLQETKGPSHYCAYFVYLFIDTSSFSDALFRRGLPDLRYVNHAFYKQSHQDNNEIAILEKIVMEKPFFIPERLV